MVLGIVRCKKDNENNCQFSYYPSLKPPNSWFSFSISSKEGRRKRSKDPKEWMEALKRGWIRGALRREIGLFGVDDEPNQ